MARRELNRRTKNITPPRVNTPPLHECQKSFTLSRSLDLPCLRKGIKETSDDERLECKDAPLSHEGLLVTIHD